MISIDEEGKKSPSEIFILNQEEIHHYSFSYANHLEAYVGWNILDKKTS